MNDITTNYDKAQDFTSEQIKKANICCENYDKAKALLSSLRTAIKVEDNEYIIKILADLKDVNFNGLDYLYTEYIYLRTKSKRIIYNN